VDDFTSRELFKDGLRRQAQADHQAQSHSDRITEMEQKHALEAEKQRAKIAHDRQVLEDKLKHDREIYEQKRRDRKEDIELNHQLARERQQEKAELTKRQKEIDHQEKYKELYLGKKVEYQIHREQQEHQHNFADREHKNRLKEKQQDHRHDINILRQKGRIDWDLAQQALHKEITLQNAKAKQDLAYLEQESVDKLEQIERQGAIDYERALDTEYAITQRTLAVEEEQTKRVLKLAKKQQKYELEQIYLKHLLFIDEKKHQLNNDLKRLKAETQAYQEKADADLERQFWEGKERIRHELIKTEAEMVRMSHANELQKDLETHRFLLMRQSGLMDREKIAEWIAEFEDGIKEIPEFK